MQIPNTPFVEFPKIARLSREIIVTEKIDGTNGQILIPELDVCACGHNDLHTQTEGCHGWTTPYVRCDCQEFKPSEEVYAGSRSQWITPEKDNMGFARWVEANKTELRKLGPGSHFGEWWGSGIQRGYGLTKGEKRFSLFNVSRWGTGGKDEAMKPACCSVVPVLYRGGFEMDAIDACLRKLREYGSVAAPGFMKPEGVVVFHTAGGHLYKKTLEKDQQPKGLA